MRIVAQRTGLCAVLVFGAFFSVQAQGGSKSPLDGIWLGTIDAGGMKLRIAVQVGTVDGKQTAVLDSLDQGAMGLPLDEISLKDGVMKFSLKAADATYEGKINKEATEIAGEWKQSGAKLPLNFKRVDKLPVAKRPQEPKPPFPYKAEEVTYENKKAGIKFAGTLTLPKGEGPFPAVLLITGSGAQDRNEEIFSHKPFLLIADYLTRRGIAVLRVDDRGVGGTTGDLDNSTTAELAEDALAGVAFLKGRKEINAKRLGLIGHSEGGVIAPLAASQSADVAFIVLLAGTGLRGDDILMRQNKLLLEAAGVPKEGIDLQLKYLAMSLPIFIKEADGKVAAKRVLDEFAAWKAKADDKDKKAIEKLESQVKPALSSMSSKWMRFFLSHDPAPALKLVQCPVLALNGEKDLQVPCKPNLESISKALKEGGNKDFTIKEFPNLNHLFQTCKTGNVSEYGTIEETMAPGVLETIAEWIAARMK